MKINFILEKNGGHSPSSLGGKSIAVVSEWEHPLKILKFDNFDSKARLSFLNGFMVLIALYQQILLQYFEGKCCYKVVL